MERRPLRITPILGAIALAAGAPSWASLIADGVTYTLFESTLSSTPSSTVDQFTLQITGINVAGVDTEGQRYGVNSFALNQPSNGSVVGGSMTVPATGWKFMTGGLNAMGCDGTGNFFCFKANSPPTAPALAANSTLTFTFDITVDQANGFNGYDPDFKVQWLGGKSGKYDLVSQTLTPSIVPLPAALPLLLGGLAGLGLMSRRKAA